MIDSMTYRLRLIDMEKFQAPPLIGRIITAQPGFSLELFRDDKHTASIRPPGIVLRTDVPPALTQARGYKGDILFRVNLMPQPHTISGTLVTKENYYRAYEITIEVEVKDPVLVVEGYRRQYDFAQGVITNFKSRFQQHTAQMEYDKISNENLPLKRWNDDFSTDLGIRISRIYGLILRHDPKYLEWSTIKHQASIEQAKIKAQIDTIEQQANIEEAKLRAQARVKRLEDEIARERETITKEHQRLEKLKLKNFDRGEDTNEQMHRLYKMLREKAADEIAEIQKELIRDAIESRKPVATVGIDARKLLNAYNRALQRGEFVDALPSIAYDNGAFDDMDEEPDSGINDTSFNSDSEMTTDEIFGALANAPSEISDQSKAVQKDGGETEREQSQDAADHPN